jgi:hypothetical protein
MNHKTTVVQRGENPNRFVINCSGCGLHLTTTNGIARAKQLAKKHEGEHESK